ncbi:MAG: hypothetical protein D6731_06115 [Planctomycetota bacterium]|nr:MAG: hypothetical protein D6731_06115 [Planctomycetota bacterium]
MRRALVLLSLSTLGCAAPAVAPEPFEAPHRAERAALLTRIAEKEAEVEKWKSANESLRKSIEELRERVEAKASELLLARQTQAATAAQLEVARAERVKLERRLREVLEQVAARELRLLQREREALAKAIEGYEASESVALAVTDNEAEEAGPPDESPPGRAGDAHAADEEAEHAPKAAVHGGVRAEEH